MSTRNLEPSNYELKSDIIGVKKDLEYLIINVQKQQNDMASIRGEVEILKQFFYRWKGAALVLVGLGGLLAWIVNGVVNALAILHK